METYSSSYPARCPQLTLDPRLTECCNDLTFYHPLAPSDPCSGPMLTDELEFGEQWMVAEDIRDTWQDMDIPKLTMDESSGILPNNLWDVPSPMYYQPIFPPPCAPVTHPEPQPSITAAPTVVSQHFPCESIAPPQPQPAMPAQPNSHVEEEYEYRLVRIPRRRCRSPAAPQHNGHWDVHPLPETSNLSPSASIADTVSSDGSPMLELPPPVPGYARHENLASLQFANWNPSHGVQPPADQMCLLVEDPMLTCPLCHRQFKKKSGLVTHSKTCTGGKPYARCIVINRGLPYT